MKQITLNKVKKAHQELESAILNNHTLIRPDYIIGFYRYWAKIDAIENALIKKGIITKEEIFQEEIPILKAMKKDLSKK